MREKSVSFEKSIERLDAIVRSLEQGNVPLEQALKLFQEGTGLVKTCDEMLSEAELQVVKLMKGADGAPVETEYTRDESTRKRWKSTAARSRNISKTALRINPARSGSCFRPCATACWPEASASARC